jgi:hypothetical protein
MARLIGWPRCPVIIRAAELGLARVKEKDWSLEEIAVLRECAHLGSRAVRLRLKTAGFHRTVMAIVIKRKRMDLTHCADGVSAFGLSRLAGIDRNGVQRWIGKGWLKAEKRGTIRTEQQGGDSQFIRYEDIQRFIWEHPDEMDLGKVEPRWFLHLVNDGRVSL